MESAQFSDPQREKHVLPLLGTAEGCSPDINSVVAGQRKLMLQVAAGTETANIPTTALSHSGINSL